VSNQKNEFYHNLFKLKKYQFRITANKFMPVLGNFMQVNQLNNDEEINDRIFHALDPWSIDVLWANEAKGDGNGN